MVMDSSRRESIDQHRSGGPGHLRNEGAVRSRLRSRRGHPERNGSTGNGRHPEHLRPVADRNTIRLLAEYQAFERIALLCAHLCRTDVRFAAVGRFAEDEQFKRGTALDAAGFDLSRPDRNTARIFGRVYELPEVTAAVVRELTQRNYAPTFTAPDAGSNAGKESQMETTQTQDPNTKLNGQQPAEEEQGFLAFVKRQCTVRNGVIATAVLVLGAAVYCYVTGGDVADVATTTA